MSVGRTKETLEALDRWLEDVEQGVIPAQLLEERGIRVLPAREIDDSCLNERLWTVIRAMADIAALPRPYDRDRFLPTHDDRISAAMQVV